VQLCLGAADALAAQGLSARVVSLPCWEWFEDQDADYRESVLPSEVPTLSVEAASSFGWDRYADASVSIDTYGASGSSEAVLEHFGFTVENVTECALALLEWSGSADATSGSDERS
jgi:transketolase